MKFFKIFFLLVITVSTSFANDPDPKEIKWISFEEAEKLNKLFPKPLLVDIYTDWCGWCKVMDKKTYKHNAIVDYINANFYPIKFNAEQKEAITFMGQKFEYVSNGRRGVHQLARAMMQKSGGGYPSTAFFTKKLELIQVVPGYLDPKKMEMLIHYIANEKYENTKWTVFQKEFKSTVQ